MAADVMTPPAITNICRCRREIGKEAERFPGGIGVSRKANWITMVTQPSPATVQHRALATPRGILEMEVIEPRQRIQVTNRCGLALLPIQPPKIDALLFHRMM